MAVTAVATGLDIVVEERKVAGDHEYERVGAPAGVKVYMVPLGKLAAELIVVFSVALLTVDVLAGLSGVTLR